MKGSGLSSSQFEIQELRRENANLHEKIRNLQADNANSLEMHSSLRETIDKLKIDNDNLHEEMTTLRIQYGECLLTNENLEAQLTNMRTDNERLLSIRKEFEIRLRAAEDQNRALKHSVDDKLVDRLQNSLSGLKKQIHEHQIQTERTRNEFEQRLNEAQRETSVEKERADSCLAASLIERQEVEKRWEERWNRHQQSLTERLEFLKSNYEKTLASVKNHEEILQKEVNTIKSKYERSKEAWEAYRKSLVEQVKQWKLKYEAKQNDLEAARQTKVEVELLYQGKSEDMESLHEIIRQGCEERQELQRQIAELKENFEEVRLQAQQEGYCSSSQRKDNHYSYGDHASSPESGYDTPYSSFHEAKSSPEMMDHCTSGYTIGPIAAKSHLMLGYNPPTTAPESSKCKPSNANTHLFTIGKGIKQSQTPTPINTKSSSIEKSKSRPPTQTRNKNK